MNTQNINTMAPSTRKNDKSKGKKFYALLDGPDPDLVRVIRCTLHHLDGTKSYIVTRMTNYTHWHCAYVAATEGINEFIYHLASEWIQISKFHTELGTMDGDDFKPSRVPHISTLPIEIPVNKVFIPGTSGRWVSLEEGRKIEAEKKLIEQKGGSNNG